MKYLTDVICVFFPSLPLGVNTMKTKLISFKAQAVILSAMAVLVVPNVFADTVTEKGGVASLNVSPTASVAPALDYAHAQAMPMPTVTSVSGSQLESLMEAQSSIDQGTPVSYPGNPGDGKLSPVAIPASLAVSSTNEVGSQEYGTSNHVFTTNRTNAYPYVNPTTTRSYPFRAAGKLYFKKGTSTYVCSASLIKRGVIVTAAHCVTQFGSKAFYSGFQFMPGYDQGVAPYGIATYKNVRVLSSYFNGTDSCQTAGVVCQNDVAVIVLNTNVGNSAGWFGYGYGYSYVNNQALITQLGYPVALDGGAWQERTDSQGYKSTTMSNNTIIGSLQTGGSSGGPWVVNLGNAPTLNGTSFGTAPSRNIVVGATSWGYVSTAVKEQGASPFTSTNVGTLVSGACTTYPASC